jgi:hypothetical protein
LSFPVPFFPFGPATGHGAGEKKYKKTTTAQRQNTEVSIESGVGKKISEKENKTLGEKKSNSPASLC